MPATDIHGRTAIGSIRLLNDDQYLIADLDRCTAIRECSLAADAMPSWHSSSQGKLLAVAEGITGTTDGALASRTIMDAVITYVTSTMPWVQTPFSDQDTTHVLGDLEDVLAGCEERLRRLSGPSGMDDPLRGTITLAYVVWPHLFVIHAGDGRCYLFRESTLYQLTTAQSLGQQLVEDHLLSPAQVARSPFAHIVSNTIGGRPEEAWAEIHHVPLQAGDRLLLCTDGLTRHLGNQHISHYLHMDMSASALCDRLIQAALTAGGMDNITVVACQFGEHGYCRSR